MPKLTLRAEVHRLVPKLFRAEVTRAEHRLPLREPVYPPSSDWFIFRIMNCINTADQSGEEGGFRSIQRRAGDFVFFESFLRPLFPSVFRGGGVVSKLYQWMSWLKWFL